MVHKKAHRRHNLVVWISCGILALLLLSGIIGLIRTEHYISTSINEYNNGRYTATLQERFDRAIPWRSIAIDLWGGIRYALFAEGVDGVIVGSDGWLFTAEEYGAGIEYDMSQEETLAFIDDAATKLRHRGVELVVLPLPSKTRLYTSYVRHRIPPAAIEIRYADFLNELRNRHITHIDMLEVFRNADSTRLFFHTDTHWTSAGARLAARAVRSTVLPIISKNGAHARIFISEKTERASAVGDLLAYLPTRIHFGRSLPHTEYITPFHTTELNPPDSGLFDTPRIPVILVGTSYSADPRWNFDGFLKEMLSADVLNLATVGEGPFDPMRELLSGTIIEEVAAQVVIWEIPERYIPPHAAH